MINKNRRILDCTLRDGAHVNYGLFGKGTANNIAQSLVDAGIELIELGFIQDVEDRKEGSTYFQNTESCCNFYESLNKESSMVGAMLRSDRCEIKNITNNDFIDFYRIAFYPEHIPNLNEYISHINLLGCELYLNPICITAWEPNQLDALGDFLETANVNGASIVDTYGALNTNTIDDLINRFNSLKAKFNTFGVHLHENLSQSISLAKHFNDNINSDDIIFDSSIFGMGRIPGNLPTELICTHLNSFFSKNYDIQKIIETGYKEVDQFRKINQWGYIPIYAMSGMLNIDRSFPEYYEKEGYEPSENIKLQKAIKNKYGVTRFSKKIADSVI